MWKKGETPWNKGKTKETDRRIENYANKGQMTIKQQFQNGRKSSNGMLNKKQSILSREKISKTLKKIGAGKWNTGKVRSSEMRKKYSMAMRGKKHALGYRQTDAAKEKIGNANKKEKNYFWKGGISFEPYSTDWTQTLRRAIRERDNYICQLCNQYGNAVHHVDYDKKNCNPNNLITLCLRCNSIVNSNRDYWTNYFKNKDNGN